MPASSHGLPTSRILETALPHCAHWTLTASIHGRCGEWPSNRSQPSIALASSSVSLPMTSKWPHSHL